MAKDFKHIEALTVLKNGVKVGELLKASGRGIYSREKETWTLAPAYDVTFATAMGEHTTDFGGRNPGKPTRKRIIEICKDYKYLKAEEYIEQTLVALSEWKKIFTRLKVPHKAGQPIFNVLEKLHKDFEK